MAKWNRMTVGTVVKGKPREDGLASKPYIKFNFFKPEQKDAFLNAVKNTDGLILNLESKKSQIESLKDAAQAGKLSPDVAEKLLARAEKIPDFVLFEVVLSQKSE
jgi:hypothetical protein